MSIIDIGYLDDTAYLEAFVSGELYNMSGKVSKASIASSLKSSVESFVRNNLDFSSPEAVGKSVLSLLVPGMLFKAHWFFGILFSFFGDEISDVLSTVVRNISGKLSSGEPVSEDEINSIGSSIGATRVNASVSPIIRSYSLESFAQTDSGAGGSFLGNNRGVGVLKNMMGFLQRPNNSAKRRGFIASLIIWFVKTVLLSAGLLITAGAVKNKVYNRTDNNSTDSDYSSMGNQNRSSNTLSSGNVETRSTGAGRETHINNSMSQWYVPVIGGSIEDMLIEWTIEIYPELSEYEDIILSSGDFRNVVSKFKQDYSYGEKSVRVPEEFKRRVDVVNYFIKNILSRLGRK